MLGLDHLKEIGLTGYEVSFTPAGPPAACSSVASRDAAVSAKTPAAKAAGSADKPKSAPKESKGAKAKKGTEVPETAAPEAAAPEAPADFKYLSEDELKKLSKAERGEYHKARTAHEKAQGTGAKKQATTKAERRELQQAKEREKEEKKISAAADAEALEEMKMQGLTEEAAKEFLAAMAKQDAQVEEEDDEEEVPQDFLGAVRAWMQGQPEVVPAEAIRDFNMKVRFQGHVDTIPPDHLGAILRNMVEMAVTGCDLNAPKLQPTTLSKLLKPATDRWASMMKAIYGKIDDPIDAVDVVVRSVQEGVAATTSAPESAQECAVVGCLMALRALDDMIEDEDLLTGCRRASKGTAVMNKFIEFLEDAVADDDDEDDEDDD
mmetsp:Transcript_4199/g.7580  ORF Transcript_4199/g.7580 Transcript_4199/m.7580 type:complete len:378 (-) Transcript_4199:76-1209(-)